MNHPKRTATPAVALTRTNHIVAAAAWIAIIVVACLATACDQKEGSDQSRHHHKEGDADKRAEKDESRHEPKEHDRKDSGDGAGNLEGAIHGKAARAAEAASSTGLAASQQPTDATGGPPAYYLTMHGTKGSDTVVGITAQGALAGNALTQMPAGVGLHELRGLRVLPDRTVLVVNAWEQNTAVLRFGPIGPDGRAPYRSVLIQHSETNPAMVHTYAVAVAPDGSIYCSNQDSNTVTRYTGLNTATPGTPLPPPSSLSGGAAAPGMFIPHDKSGRDGLAEVRGITFGPDGLLYVADRGHAFVAAYDPTTGRRTRIVADKKDGLKHPIQVAFDPDGSGMYITDNGPNCVWRADLKAGGVRTFVPHGTHGMRAPGALLIDGDRLLVGCRESKRILSVHLPDGAVNPEPFITGLPDSPEWLAKVP